MQVIDAFEVKANDGAVVSAVVVNDMEHRWFRVYCAGEFVGHIGWSEHRELYLVFDRHGLLRESLPALSDAENTLVKVAGYKAMPFAAESAWGV
ncbi:MAG: hypothetical protein MUD01_06085 [Chloroflexaceae bacterium]|jgi:hypothetical protein|nr:hypothetical protein [Chloroflexaceae bacterium]